ncbi:MAG: hypothetical protein ACJ8IR_00480 [Alphaproteobacteria bacterium]|jgi:hypothetical protein
MFQRQMVLAASVLAMIAAQNSMAEAKSTRFSLPDGTNGLYVTGPNASGDVAGIFLTSGNYNSHSYGFIRSADGSFTTIDVKKSYRHNTIVEAIDDADDVVGQYEEKDDPNIDHAFLRTPNGTLTSFDAPGAYNTLPFNINAGAGEMVGWYYTADGNHGFVRSMDGTLTTIDYPGATGGTYPYAVNAQGQITGSYRDSDGVRHGFLRQPGGSIKTIDPPNSLYTDNVVLNDKGQISGIYQDSGSGSYYGFVRDGGTFYAFDEYFGRLNARHQAVGQIFLLTFQHKEFKTNPLNLPKGCSDLFLSGINDSGLISGSMRCGHGKWFGYLTSK